MNMKQILFAIFILARISVAQAEVCTSPHWPGGSVGLLNFNTSLATIELKAPSSATSLFGTCIESEQKARSYECDVLDSSTSGYKVFAPKGTRKVTQASLTRWVWDQSQRPISLKCRSN